MVQGNLEVVDLGERGREIALLFDVEIAGER